MKPVFPINLLTMPFCQNGTKTIIPADTAISGRATLKDGFPIETQLPEDNGGVAPNRQDFNGALYLSTAMLFWLQSGGQAVYQASLNYPVPSIAYHDGVLYWCVAENGPDTEAGVVAPGTNDAVWTHFFRYLLQSTGEKLAPEVPVGTIIMYPSATPPDDFFVCDGSGFSATTYPRLFAVLGRASVPDMRGLFVRGHDPAAIRDPDGASRPVCSVQTDAGRNITGAHGAWNVNAFGCFSYRGNANTWEAIKSGGSSNCGVDFDASRAWGADHTAPEFRPANISMQYCIKHD